MILFNFHINLNSPSFNKKDKSVIAINTNKIKRFNIMKLNINLTNPKEISHITKIVYWNVAAVKLAFVGWRHARFTAADIEGGLLRINRGIPTGQRSRFWPPTLTDLISLVYPEKAMVRGNVDGQTDSCKVTVTSTTLFTASDNTCNTFLLFNGV